ncbi:replication factor C subunit 3-like isoform X2 [Arachis stenosperma]|uniref:replication factor C subunit 3-like isoform X2 n=1 Tax=Arachis stenosperma TaxID=217475 RepID=UPI0025AC27C4|nr:replication factor C subunit 3-like isoform X2 [Arachis stenosperma]
MQQMTSPTVSKNRNGLRSMLQVNLQQAYHHDMMKNSNDESSNSNSSPYYKGLTDQSLAIFAPSSPPHHHHDHATIPCYPITPLPLPSLHPHLSSSGSGAQGQSPYYKGLTDYSLVIGSWSSHNPTSTNPSYHPQSSPYYRGLTDFSLVLHDHPQETEIDPNDGEVEGDLVLIQEDHKTVLTEEVNAKGVLLVEMEVIDATHEEEKPLRERVTVTPDLDDDDLQDTRTKEDIYHHHQEITSLQEDPNAYQYEWATKHQPQTLEEFICNSDKALQLQALVREGCGCNHFIFEGPPNVGKRSMIRAMLRELFGPRLQVIEESRDFTLKGEMVDKLQVQIKKSLHHVEINVSETKGYEKHVIVDLFNRTYAKTINNSLPCSPDNCQAIVLYEAEKLSIESLLYIKWQLEKYKGCNKVFFCCSDESKFHLIKPLCTTLRLSPPSSQEILRILEHIGEKEGKQLSRGLLNKIIFRSRNNLRQAIRSLEATCRNKDILGEEDLILTGWEYDILIISKSMLEEQSPRQLYLIRRKLQSLMIHDVSAEFVYKSLVERLTTLIDASLRSGVAKLDMEYKLVRLNLNHRRDIVLIKTNKGNPIMKNTVNQERGKQ